MDVLKKIEKLQNHLRANNFDIVINECRKLIKKNPNNSFLHNLCGLALQGNNNLLVAIDYLKKAIDLDPNNIAAKNNLANSYKSIGKLDKAEMLYKRILKEKPDYINAINNYGNLKQLIFDYDNAINLYEKALKIKEDPVILFALANAHHAVGNFDKTREIIKKILIKNPKHVSAHKLLSSIVNYEENRDHIKEMENLFNEKDLSDLQTIDLSFALGKAYEDIKNYDKSFQYLEKANKLKKQKIKYDPKIDEKLFNTLIEAFKNFDFKKNEIKGNKKKIIFICGMPRSGTTLVEQILASHKKVHGAGELVYLQRTIYKNFINEKKFIKQKLIDEINSRYNQINADYFNMLSHHNIEKSYITDKAPQNFRWIGLIKIFFPDSKIIHCSRNPKDNCLSLYKNSFASSDLDWAYDQKDIANYYNLYLNLMKFWETKLGKFIYEVNYEKLVKNKDDETKKMINYCELEWDEACLNHHENKKTPIKTVSISQARKPIYQSSVNSNSNYEKYLNEMFSKIKYN